jgi:hypothetical protein
MKAGLIYETPLEEEPIYRTWLKYANERDVLEEVLRERFGEWCYTQPLSMIEWGCGLGSAARRFWGVLGENQANFTYTGVDPFSDQLERFRKDVGEDLPVRLRKGSFESFEPGQKYDLGLAIHSLYYAKSIPETVAKISRSSKKMLFIHHGLNGINTVHEAFPHLVLQEASEISTHENICKALEELSIPYDLRIYHTETQIAVTHDLNNPEGRNMIKFFLDNPKLEDRAITEVSDFLSELGPIMRHDMAMIITK